MRRPAVVLTVISAPLCARMALAAEEGLTRELGTKVVTGRRPTSLPTQIPTTVEGITGEELAVTINATDAEDALKYFPSLLVRKRYVGDYDHAVLASRARTRASSRTPTFRPASANGRVPDWRANAVATYHLGERWLVTLGARYSGQQFNTLDNSDPNGMSYTGVSEFFVVDTRVRYVGDRWNASLGIDNLNNEEYWNFHPYTQRTFAAEIGVEF